MKKSIWLMPVAFVFLIVVGTNESDAARRKPRLGAFAVPKENSWTFRLHSANATRVELSLYRSALGEEEIATYLLEKVPQSQLWMINVPTARLKQLKASGTIFYGYRVWGPNWPYDPSWKKGSRAGFIADVDAQGNRFNPNKLLIDPYAKEISHDPRNPAVKDEAIYLSGDKHRHIDTGKFAPKSILMADPPLIQSHVRRPLRDEIIYEVHVRGLTKNDPDVPEKERGTYRGAARKAAYLKKLGVTAVEFLPLQETQNDANDLVASTDGDNYWGYMTLNYFAPDRRYSADKSPTGPTKEFRAMVEEFHRHGIKVYIDVVYNHTAEGGIDHRNPNVALLTSFRGIDNQTYYELAQDRRHYRDNTGIGHNVNMLAPATRDLILDSLAYWHRSLGVDGFRFDLATVLGNVQSNGNFHFDPSPDWSPLQRAVRELPARRLDTHQGVDLIAEPWAIGLGTYQVGNFPRGWSEWNGRYRDTFRIHQNKLGINLMTPAWLAAHFSGSSYLFRDDGRHPWNSINFLVAHDGFTHKDLYSYNDKVNNRPWPYGPSDGGTDENYSWDQDGNERLQRQAARNGFAILMLSNGVPMFTGGDEFLRTQFGNNNSYNLDSPANWLNWAEATKNREFLEFVRELIAFRKAHPSFTRPEFTDGVDKNGNGLKDVFWARADGKEAHGEYMDNPRNTFLGFVFDATEVKDESVQAIYVAYNGSPRPERITLPYAFSGSEWRLQFDTAHEKASVRERWRNKRGTEYEMQGRSLTVWVR